MEVCVFDKNHKMKKSLFNHYIKSHLKKYNECRINGWYCIKNTLNLFINKEQKEKHDKKCTYCQKFKENKNENDISEFGLKVIEEKLPKDKRNFVFPIFDFDAYIKKEKDNYIKENDFLDDIEEEKNIL